ncbi:DTW domain-containing protein 1 [Habropoda laboriosa]|uniref:tRNA-uridine aminocarboxypropyltransferase 1 n=1 Tax=Habropoda laboriosa TaxID=597456 RepID=A0A0L7QZG8_9HYME|nr:PREDICTED: DTW domain-containing protein 1-like [Habropoda laboriosa]KOC63937.1 DTW domain-containing protein 1 [Habropoda laboriosa]
MAKSEAIRNIKKHSNMEKEQKIIDKMPFRHLKIGNAQILDTVEGREICDHCFKSRKFFCYSCCLPVINENYFPRIKLPVKIDIIKHAREIDGKSTAAHAAILAPEDVKIFTYPDFPEILNKEETVLIFPSQTGVTVDSLFTKVVIEDNEIITKRIKNMIPIKKAIFIDSTWHQTKAIYKDQRLRDLQCVILKSRISQFWRHQKESPRWYLATIEAIHQFLIELHTCAFGMVQGYASIKSSEEKAVNEENSTNNIAQQYVNELPEMDQRYRGQYDDLLYFFKYMYEKIHTMYDHDKLWAYKRPLM